jgi:hypothetical protein
MLVRIETMVQLRRLYGSGLIAAKNCGGTNATPSTGKF